MCMCVSPQRNDKVWLVSQRLYHRLSLGRGVNRKKQAMWACNVPWHWKLCLCYRTESIVRDHGWHIIESSMSASMISITNSRGFVWSRENVCHSTSWQTDPSPLAPALLLPSKEHSGLGDRQRSLPPVRLDQLSQDTEEAPGPQFTAGFWAFEYPEGRVSQLGLSRCDLVIRLISMHLSLTLTHDLNFTCDNWSLIFCSKTAIKAIKAKQGRKKLFILLKEVLWYYVIP